MPGVTGCKCGGVPEMPFFAVWELTAATTLSWPTRSDVPSATSWSFNWRSRATVTAAGSVSPAGRTPRFTSAQSVVFANVRIASERLPGTTLSNHHQPWFFVDPFSCARGAEQFRRWPPTLQAIRRLAVGSSEIRSAIRVAAPRVLWQYGLSAGLAGAGHGCG
mmetsp:Transcript_61865/g.142479  ORF Transcript_61865/g.142479 Transcript_61865/m.142479 type:complete len:163 (-) Transcript_61865:143-631(-)